jgi:hypothetical protein
LFFVNEIKIIIREPAVLKVWAFFQSLFSSMLSKHWTFIETSLNLY